MGWFILAQLLSMLIQLVQKQQVTATGPIRRRDVLGFIGDYYRGSDPTTVCPA
jgi:hypothetical protein